jgi:hypothetical protein
MSLVPELIGGVVGVAVGLAAGYGNMLITKRAVQKQGTAGLIGMNTVRMLVNFAVVLVIFLLRKVSPLGFYGTLLGAAVGLSVGNIFFIVRLSRQWSEQTIAEADAAQQNGGESDES